MEAGSNRATKAVGRQAGMVGFYPARREVADVSTEKTYSEKAIWRNVSGRDKGSEE